MINVYNDIYLYILLSLSLYNSICKRMKTTSVNRICMGFMRVCQFKLINCFILNLGCSDPPQNPKNRVPKGTTFRPIQINHLPVDNIATNSHTYLQILPNTTHYPPPSFPTQHLNLTSPATCGILEFRGWTSPPRRVFLP